MRIPRLFVPLALFGTAVACGDVPNDTGARLLVPAGVIRGTVVYQGPRPCSRNGHIVGNAILLVFDRRNPPPPNGVGVTAANFNDVTGDVLFGNEPRFTGSDTYCPLDHGFTETITVSAPFEIAPMAGGSYEIQSFFDYTGDFLPTFKFRQLPEMGDIGGGYVDTADALKPSNSGNANYQPHFLAIDVGTPRALPSGAPPGAIPVYDVPSSGYVADNVTVSVGLRLPSTRPYFYAAGETIAAGSDPFSVNTTIIAQSDKPGTPGDPNLPGTQETDPNYLPILTFPQDLLVFAQPTNLIGGAEPFEQKLPHLRLTFGVPAATELAPATASVPFRFQLDAQQGQPQGAFSVWQNQAFIPSSGQWVPLQIPEGKVPQLWPLIVLAKLVDDPGHTTDPASLGAQGSAGQPAVIIQGITVLPANKALSGSKDAAHEDLINTALDGTGTGLLNADGTPKIFQSDHITVALRPSVICFDQLFNNENPDKRGTLVTPYSSNVTSDPGPNPPTGPIVPDTLLNPGNDTIASVSNLVKAVQYGCMPTGRYGINVVYPDGQAWTVPNEAGACSGTEGSTDFSNLTCTLKPRPVLRSQGPRAVVEITATTNPANCKAPPPAAGPPNKDAAPATGPAPAIPSVCQPTQ